MAPPTPPALTESILRSSISSPPLGGWNSSSSFSRSFPSSLSSHHQKLRLVIQGRPFPVDRHLIRHLDPQSCRLVQWLERSQRDPTLNLTHRNADLFPRVVQYLDNVQQQLPTDYLLAMNTASATIAFATTPATTSTATPPRGENDTITTNTGETNEDDNATAVNEAEGDASSVSPSTPAPLFLNEALCTELEYFQVLTDGSKKWIQEQRALRKLFDESQVNAFRDLVLPASSSSSSTTTSSEDSAEQERQMQEFRRSNLGIFLASLRSGARWCVGTKRVVLKPIFQTLFTFALGFACCNLIHPAGAATHTGGADGAAGSSGSMIMRMIAGPRVMQHHYHHHDHDYHFSFPWSGSSSNRS